MSILEKAMTVSHGRNYKNLNGLSANNAFLALTGQSGTVVEGTVGSANQDVFAAIFDAVTNGQQYAVEFILPSDLPSFDSYDTDAGDLKLDIGTMMPVEDFAANIEFVSGKNDYYFMSVPAV
jgi:hypothetical protein